MGDVGDGYAPFLPMRLVPLLDPRVALRILDSAVV
jgi:hypothetical protein